MKLRLELDLSKCCACGACAVACMDQNDIDTDAGDRPYRTVFREESGKEPVYYSIACMHCDGAPCVAACPAGCIFKDEETGLTLYDNTNCIGCHSCAMACPFGAPAFGADGKMRKCDGCVDRVRAGLAPACVKGCTFDALKLTDIEKETLPPERSLVYKCALLAESQR